MHLKGYAAPETKAAVERARLLIEQAEALGEPPNDPLLLFSVLYGFWVASFVAFNGDVMRELAVQFLGAPRNKETTPSHDRASPHGCFLDVYWRHREGRAHFDQRACALRFCRASSAGGAIWPRHSEWQLVLSSIGSVDAWLSRGRGRRSDHALKDAREIGQAATLMFALALHALTHICCGNYAAANALLDELVALADEKGALVLKAARNDASKVAYWP